MKSNICGDREFAKAKKNIVYFKKKITVIYLSFELTSKLACRSPYLQTTFFQQFAAFTLKAGLDNTKNLQVFHTNS